MAKVHYTIGVTGLNAIDSPGPGVGVIRAIRSCDDFEVRIIGLVYESLEPGIYLHDIVDKSYQIPYPSAGREALLHRLEYIHEKEKIDLVIPNFDAELYNFIKLVPDLNKLGIRSFLPSLGQLESIDKMHLFEFGETHGFNIPDTIFISSKSQIKDLEDDFDYPMVVKGRFYEAYIAYNEGQVSSYFDKLNAKWGLPVVIQEFVKGTEIDVAGLGSQGKLIGAIPMRKLYITEKGKGWSGIVLEDPELILLTRKFVESSNLTGGFEVEIMRTQENKMYIMEVNPRFPAWIFTTVAAGQNLPAALVRMVMGAEVEPFLDYKPGTMFVRYSWDHVTDISEFEKISNYGEY